jgi:hypothetical protein
MSIPNQGGVLKNMIFFVVIPLFVFVAGGLAVEYLKPKPDYGSGMPATSGSAGTTSPTTSGSAGTNSSATPGPGAQPMPSTRAAEMKALLVKKWYIVEKPKAYGDLEVEFTEFGKVVRTYKRLIISDAVETYNYQITPEGELKSDAPNLQLVKLTKDELTLNWGNNEVASYKRGWYWWEIALIVGAIVLFIIICVGLKAAFDKK